MADAEWKTNDLENAEFRGWTECAKAMRQYDEGMIKGWKEEIDTLLVFVCFPYHIAKLTYALHLQAGLFSAVLTAFSLESYQLLQPDPQETTVHLLTLLTQSSLSNITIPSPLIPAFKPPSSAVRINTFWFASLVCALLSALLGILVKQWLREYLSTGLTAPRDFVRLRHFRFAGLGAWRVPDIVAVLPLLLQIALVLFFGGLLDLLWTLHPVVAGITTALVALSLSLVSATVIAPFFSPTCPYRSPFALHLARVLKPSTSPHSRTDIPATWFDRDLIHTSSSPSPRKTSDLDQPALSWAFAHLRSDSLLDLLAPCAKALRPRARATLILHDLASHAAFAPHVLLRALRQGPYAAVDALYDKLVPGHRGAARTLALVLDLLPELPTRDSLSRLSRTTTAEPMSKDIPNRQDLLTLLHPLLGAFIASGAQRYGTRAHLIQKTLGVLVSLGTYDGEPGSSVDMAWRTIVVFSHLFWKHVTLAGKCGLYTSWKLVTTLMAYSCRRCRDYGGGGIARPWSKK